MTTSTTRNIPHISTDPYAKEVLLDRSGLQREVREAAPVTYLTSHGIYATGRYDVVREVFADWQHFQVGAGVGLSNFYTEEPWRPPAMPTEADPPLHDMPRRVLTDVLSMRTLRRLQDHWLAEAEEFIDTLLARGNTFEAMADLAAGFPLKVFPDAVGLPADRRRDLLAYGDLVFNAFGPRNDLFNKSAQGLAELSAWITHLCQRENLTEGGFGAMIWDAADRGELTQEHAPLVVRSLLSAGIDTTIHGICAIVHAFATHPEEWQRLRSDLTLVRRGFDEAVRWASPLQYVFHTTGGAVDLYDVTIPEHQKVLLLIGAANRDPRRWEDPDTFTLERDPSGHVGFGMGLHQCVGQHVARLEAEALLTVLAQKVETLELAGTPKRGLNNTLQTWQRMPIRVVR